MRGLIERLESRGGSSPIDGKSKVAAVNYIRKLVGRTNDGFFSDEYWTPVNKTFKILSNNNIPYEISNTRYDKDNGIPVRKTWFLEIPYRDKRNMKKVSRIYGTITAAGAGSVQDPLDRYDVTLVLN